MERRQYTYFSLLEGFSLARIMWVQVQGNDCTSDEDPPGPQNRQSHDKILRQPEPDLGNNSQNQDARRLQNRQQKNDHMDEIKVVNQKEKGFPISIVTAGLHPKGCQTWFPIQIQKQRNIVISNHEKKKGVQRQSQIFYSREKARNTRNGQGVLDSINVEIHLGISCPLHGQTLKLTCNL